MKVVTAETMRALDRRAIEEFGIPAAVLMENAGRAVVERMAREYGPLRGRRVLVFCGGGNNGGDGFVAARYLHLAGAQPLLCMVGRPELLKAEARVHWDLAQGLHLPVAGWEEGRQRLEENGADLIVDALFGTGVKEAPRAPYAEVIAAINASGRPIIAIDIPSGVDSDTGATPGEAVLADHTVTFGYPKIGLFLPPGADCAGALHVSDIGFDWDQIEIETPYRLLDSGYSGIEALAISAPIQSPGPPLAPFLVGRAGPGGPWACGGVGKPGLLRPRAAESNKGDFGHVAVVGGSRGMVGAPCMVARAAQRVGAGLVTVLAPESAQPVIAGKLDEQMTLPLPDIAGSLSIEAFDAIAAFAEKASVLCIGPGMTTAPVTVGLVQRLLSRIEKPIVLDADGLNALAQRPDLLASRPHNPRAPLILTPHPGEAARLLGTSVTDVQSNRLEAVRSLAARFQAIAVLKGRRTLIADPAGNISINVTGNPGMATGGMGDALTGIIGGLLAQAVAPGREVEDLEEYRRVTVRPEDAAALGVFLHGLAGDLAAARAGQIGLVTGDLIECIPAAIRRLEEGI
ncbi:MAG TPA: NAD(P)H-hydrate dehydratase [Chthonomonadaceae bacterium]|nr:NAD(P)H-hydrate dehydratase [Chthonomonadaceae bacterium]